MKFVLFVTLIWSILDSGWSITDEDLMRIEAGLAHIQILKTKVEVLENEKKELHSALRDEQLMNQELRHELRQFKAEQLSVNQRQEELNIQLKDLCQEDLHQNTTIEERVLILEAQMTEVQEDLVSVEEDLDFLFQEQVIQDERILNVEERTFILELRSEGLEERVEVLEADGGGGGNVTELEERVETLEGTAAEHEADIADLESVTSNLDGRVETLEADAAELDTRLTSAETMIEDLQATDVELDSRISDLEEGGETVIAFRAVMADDDDAAPDIPFGTVIFSELQLNQGNGYDLDTGVFTVPSGGEGYYYFATHFTVATSKQAYIDLRVNDVMVCTMYDDNDNIETASSNGGCNAVVFLSEGDEVENVYWYGIDSEPVIEADTGVYNGFTGFRI